MEAPKEPHSNLSEASIQTMSKTMDFAQKFWCKARAESHGRISRDLLDSVDSAESSVDETIAQLAHSIWRRLKPPHWDMLKNLEEALEWDGYVHFPCFRDLMQTILHEADVDLQRLKSIHHSPLRTVTALLKNFFILLKESRQAQASSSTMCSSLRPISVPSRADQLISWAKENGLGDIEVPSNIYVSERSKLAIIEKQISGRLKLISMAKQKHNGTGGIGGGNFYTKDAEWKRKTRKLYQLKKNSRCSSAPKKQESRPQSVAPSPAQATESPLDHFPVKLKPEQKFFFGTAPPPPPGPSVTPEVYTRPLLSPLVDVLESVDEPPPNDVSRGNRLETLYRNELFQTSDRSVSKAEETSSTVSEWKETSPESDRTFENESHTKEINEQNKNEERLISIIGPNLDLTTPAVYQCLDPTILDHRGDTRYEKDEKLVENGVTFENKDPKNSSEPFPGSGEERDDEQNQFETAPLMPSTVSLVPTLRLRKLQAPKRLHPGAMDEQRTGRSSNEIRSHRDLESAVLSQTESDGQAANELSSSEGTIFPRQKSVPSEQFSSVEEMPEIGPGDNAATDEVLKDLLEEPTFDHDETSLVETHQPPALYAEGNTEVESRASCSSPPRKKLYAVALMSLLVGFGSFGYFISYGHVFSSSFVFPNGIQFTVLIEKLWNALKPRQSLY